VGSANTTDELVIERDSPSIRVSIGMTPTLQAPVRAIFFRVSVAYDSRLSPGSSAHAKDLRSRLEIPRHPPPVGPRQFTGPLARCPSVVMFHRTAATLSFA
jgi:hypothetical protein